MRTIAILLFILVSLAPLCAKAHPGKTDENGGHYDYSTGEYHYHHGYPAHDHYDIDGDGTIDCPYDFEDLTGKNSSSNESSGNGEHYSGIATKFSEEAFPKTSWQRLKCKVVAMGILGTISYVLAVAFASFPIVCGVLLLPVCEILWAIGKLSNKEPDIVWFAFSITASSVLGTIVVILFSLAK